MAGKRLNLGCGKTHLKGYINIDINEELGPDVVFDFLNNPLPYDEDEIEEIVLSHVIEHIPGAKHIELLTEFHRVLKTYDGSLFLAYPEFIVCAKNYIENKQGMREYWAATLYGRQTSIWDFHVALMNTKDALVPLLESLGFGKINYHAQEGADYNTVLRAFKITKKVPTLELKFKEVFPSEVFQVRKG